MPLMKHRRKAAQGAQGGANWDGMTWPQLQRAAASRGYKGPRNKAAVLDFLRSNHGDQ